MKILTYKNDTDRDFALNACRDALMGVGFGGVGVGRGLPIIVPTETVYGLCCLPSDCASVKRIFEIKRRDRAKPLAMLAGSLAFLFDASCRLSGSQLGAIEKFCNAGTTFIVGLPADCDFLRRNKICEGTMAIDGGGLVQIGVRVPQHRFCQSLLRILPSQIMVGTSCNFSGEPPIETLKNIGEGMAGEIEIGVENNDAEGEMSQLSSTIINLNEAEDNKFGFAIVR